MSFATQCSDLSAKAWDLQIPTLMGKFHLTIYGLLNPVISLFTALYALFSAVSCMWSHDVSEWMLTPKSCVCDSALLGTSQDALRWLLHYLVVPYIYVTELKRLHKVSRQLFLAMNQILLHCVTPAAAAAA